MYRNIPTKRIVILGNGLLGSTLHKLTGWDVISRKEDGFDITKPELFYQYFLECHEGVSTASVYDVIVNCIGNTDTYSVDKSTHWDVNYKGVADLTEFCNTNNIKLVHISSDYVYTNSITQASEDDIPVHGANWYSYTKLLADAYIELKSKNYLICRGTHKQRPFMYDRAWVDQIGNFDYVDTISEIIKQLVETQAQGVYNVGTELKSMFTLSQQTKETVPAHRTADIPQDVSMNINKLHKYLKESSYE
jgi:dTDP-4-dehydrorhamnose reductase